MERFRLILSNQVNMTSTTPDAGTTDSGGTIASSGSFAGANYSMVDHTSALGAA